MTPSHTSQQFPPGPRPLVRRDWIDIGPGPADEPCAQVGAPDYRTAAVRECQTFINQIRRELGPEPPGARLAIKWSTAGSFPGHTYAEVVCYFDHPNTHAFTYALDVEAHAPTEWDDKSLAELKENQK